ncbi:hypothetical protein [Sneathiella limimaris]|uniref:hypothetical protein n=1 Tax=Sneathiella limimaris TaxID=1964213 RepID=UPI00146B213C|nr:hypothetical protein [Sneathiella limimaris]
MARKFTYPAPEIRKEYFRAGIGMILTGVPLLLFRPSSVIVSLLGFLFCLFFLYGIRSYLRSRLTVFLGQDGICCEGNGRKEIRWEDLTGLRLSYFSSRRDGEKGWMQLRLKSRGISLKVESTINEFSDLVAICMSVAKDRGLVLDPATVRNLRALGLLEDASDTQHYQGWGKE